MVIFAAITPTQDDDQESIVMPDKNGQKFLCYLPKVEREKSGKPVIQHNISGMIVEIEKRIKQKTPDELLEVLKGPCFIRQEVWWSYEFCYQKKLRQLHLEDEKVVQEFVLGVYDPEATAAFNQNLSDISTLKDPRSKDASQRNTKAGLYASWHERFGNLCYVISTLQAFRGHHNQDLRIKVNEGEWETCP